MFFMCTLDVAQGNFTEELALPAAIPTQKDGTATKERELLRPELSSTFIRLCRVYFCKFTDVLSLVFSENGQFPPIFR